MKNGFLYLCAVMDWHSRFVLSCQLSNTLLVDFCLDTLQQALDRWGSRAFSIQIKPGGRCRSQFTSPRFLSILDKADIQISMDSKGRALNNIFVERLWRTVKYEHVYLHAYSDGLALNRGLTAYFNFYNYRRKHQSLAYQTPAAWYGKGEKNTTLPPSDTISN